MRGVAERVLAGLVVIVVASAAAPLPTVFGDRVTRVHARRGQGTASSLHAGHAARTRCVGIDHVAGAVVFGDRAVELTMTDRSRWRMGFDEACPALSFYQGFYYRRAVAGRLCAGRDAVIARSGGTCPITTIVRLSR